LSSSKQIFTHSSIYAIGNISRQLISFVMLPIYTNYLTPEDYGAVALLIFLVSLIEIIFGGQLFQAVPKYYHQSKTTDEKRAVVSTALLLTTFFSSFAFIIIAVFREPTSTFLFGTNNYSIYVGLFSSLILLHAFEQYGLTFIRILKKPWLFLWLSMAKLVTQLSLNILLIVYFDLGLLGIVTSSIISSILISAVLVGFIIRKCGFDFNQKIGKTMIKFSWPLWLSGLIGLYIGSSNRYFLRIFSDLTEVGLFELAVKFSAIISSLIWLPFSQYWQTERFQIAKTDAAYTTYNNVFKSVSVLLFSSAIGIALFTPIVIEFMSSELFHPAAKAVPYLALAAVFGSLTIFHNFSFIQNENTIEITKNNTFAAIILTFSMFIFVPTYGFVGAAIGAMITSILHFVATAYRSRFYYDLKLKYNFLSIALAGYWATILLSDYFTPTSILHSLLVNAVLFVVSSGIFAFSILSRSNKSFIANKIRGILG
jgi:O-antigen/teichoic acid export membrane protein